VNRLGSIQRLRALAALGVALFHACQWSGLDFAVGAAGVDLFFVISGFVLWSSADDSNPSPGAFLAARLARVAPLYWLATLAVAALVLWRPRAMPVAQFEPWHLVLSLLFIPHDDPAGDAFPLLPSGWTLTYEAFFYLAFALALACPKARRLQVLSGVVLTVSIWGFFYPRLYPLLANPLLLEFLLGVRIARLWRRGLLRKLDPRLGWGAVALGLLAYFALQVGGVRSDFWRPLFWGPPAALLVIGAVMVETAGGMRRDQSGLIGRALEGLGDASYSLYLCQLPVICAFAWFARGLSPSTRAPLAFALAIVAGLVCHRLVETPIRRGLKALARSRRDDRAQRGRALGSAEEIALAAVDPDLA
jgi:exopolysaccharide production protein ExoZ